MLPDYLYSFQRATVAHVEEQKDTGQYISQPVAPFLRHVVKPSTRCLMYEQSTEQMQTRAQIRKDCHKHELTTGSNAPLVYKFWQGCSRMIGHEIPQRAERDKRGKIDSAF